MNIDLLITDWSSNGTHALLVMRNGDLVDCLDEAVFGMREALQREAWIDHDGQPLWAVSLNEVLAHIAMSPVSDGSEVERFLKVNGLFDS